MTDDLFPEIPGGTFKSLAYPAAPGSGPKGPKCVECDHFRRVRTPAGYWHSKCGLMSMSSSSNTDISMYSPACSFFEWISKGIADPDDHDDEDPLQDAIDECGIGPDGYCGLAGTEHCDFACPFRDSPHPMLGDDDV